MVVITTTTSLAPVRRTMGGGREVLRMLPGPLIMEDVTMEEEDGTMEVVDGTMEEEDGIMEGTGIMEVLGQDITLATTMEVMEEEGDVSETVSVPGLSSVAIYTEDISAQHLSTNEVRKCCFTKYK